MARVLAGGGIAGGDASEDLCGRRGCGSDQAALGATEAEGRRRAADGDRRAVAHGSRGGRRLVACRRGRGNLFNPYHVQPSSLPPQEGPRDIQRDDRHHCACSRHRLCCAWVGKSAVAAVHARLRRLSCRHPAGGDVHSARACGRLDRPQDQSRQPSTASSPRFSSSLPRRCFSFRSCHSPMPRSRDGPLSGCLTAAPALFSS